MRPDVFGVAARAWPAIQKLGRFVATKDAKPRVWIAATMEDCPICHKRHVLALGEPRCIAPLPVSVADKIFGKAVAIGLLAFCLGFSGCASSHFYVSGINIGAGETASDGKEVTAGIVISPNPYAYKAIVPLK